MSISSSESIIALYFPKVVIDGAPVDLRGDASDMCLNGSATHAAVFPSVFFFKGCPPGAMIWVDELQPIFLVATYSSKVYIKGKPTNTAFKWNKILESLST